MDGVRQPQQPKTEPAPEENTQPASPTPPPDQENGEPQAPDREQKGLSGMNAGFLIGAALLFDGIQALVMVVSGLTIVLAPLGIAIAWVINIFAAGTFYLWLRSLGLSMIKKGGGAGFTKSPFPFILGGALFEFIPGLNALPGWTGTIFFLVIRERVGQYFPAAGGSPGAPSPS